MNSKFKKIFTVLVTPFYKNEVDYESIEKIVDDQLKNNIKGFVLNGTTSENPTLTELEIKKIFSTVRAMVGLDFPLVLGTGTNSTSSTVTNTQKACDLGADAALVVVPYYNKPSQSGLLQHYKAVAECSDLPVIMYNVPSRTIVSMAAETIIELSHIKNIIGIKEASGNLVENKKIINESQKDFIVLSGDDGSYIDFLKLGGHGLMSVMSNLIPKETLEWSEQIYLNKNAEINFNKYLNLINGMYVEANPIPIKWMLYKKNIIRSPELRLPLTVLDEKYHQSSLKLMTELGII